MTHILRDVSSFNKEEWDAFFASFDTVLSDCDGVLWAGDTPLEGSLEVINRLKELGKKVFLISNNCTLTMNQYMKKIKKFGLNVSEDEVIIPSLVAVSYLKEQNLKKKAYILATPAVKEMFESNDIICSSDVGPDYVVETIEEFKEEVQKLDQEVGAVVMDLDANINYIKMMKAVLHLRNPDCLFVVGGTDVLVPFEDFIILVQTYRIHAKMIMVPNYEHTAIKEVIQKLWKDVSVAQTVLVGSSLATQTVC